MAQRENPKLELRVAEEPIAEKLPESGSAPAFPELLILLAKRKWFIMKFTGIVALLSVALSLALPVTYTATTRIMPPQQNQSMSSSALLSQLGPLAALAGQGLGLRNPSDLYVAMLQSETVTNGIVDRFRLRDLYKAKVQVDARKRLEGLTQISAEKSGVITISVEDQQTYWLSSSEAITASQKRAAALANGYVDELEKLTKELAISEAGKRRLFFERETKMASDDLAAAELALKQTQEKTGLIMLDPQSKAIIDTAASLRARISLQQVIVQSMSSYATPENPDLIRSQREVAALQEQLDKLERGTGGKKSILDLPIENVPTAGLEYIRKFREVKYREAVFELLAKQYEAAKIDEARDSFIVQQLDPATPPERKSSPHRSTIVLIMTLLGVTIATLIAFYREYMENAKNDPGFAQRLQLFRFYLRGRGLRG